MYSKELSKVFQKALSIICNDIDEGISSKDLFIAMALTKTSYAAEALARLGINEEIAKSFVMNTYSNNGKQRRITEQAEAAIRDAKDIANKCEYKNICSHHLLLAIVKQCDPRITQMLMDYSITYDKIKEITKAMSHNGIGKEEENEAEGRSVKIISRMKDKKLEKELLDRFRVR